MDYNASERQGRFLLRALLWFILLCEAARALLPMVLAQWPAQLTAILTAAALLPAAVVLWAVYRGSYPGLAVFFLSTFELVVSVTDFLAPGGPQLMGELISGPMGAFFTASLFFSIVSLILRLLTVYNIFRSDTVSRYFDCRRCRRRRKDLILEIALFAAALIAQYLVNLWL